MTSSAAFIHKAAVVGLMFCAIFVLQLGYWMTWPYHIIDVKGLKVLDTEIEVGEYLEYSLDYCKDKQYEFLRAQVQLSFRDGVIYNLPLESGPLVSGCTQALFVLRVPAVPEGKYHLEMVREYSVNPLRKVEVRAVSNVFKVSNARRFKEMLKQQLPPVIHEVAPKIPELR